MHNEFTVHILNESGIAKAQTLASEFDGLLSKLETICGNGTREMAIVRTKLEEASFFAKKAMANLAENQKEPG